MPEVNKLKLPQMPGENDSGGFHDIGSLASMRAKAEKLETDFVTYIEGLETKIGDAAQKAIDQIKDMKNLGVSEAQMRASKAMAERKRLREDTVETRNNYAAQAELMASNVVISDLAWGTPVTAITTLCAAKPEFAAQVGRLALAGPTELYTNAVAAIGLRDRVLAAAVVTVQSRGRRNAALFDYKDLAEKFVGQECKVARAHVLAINAVAKRVVARNEEFYHGRDRDSNQKISLGLAGKKVKEAEQAAGLKS